MTRFFKLLALFFILPASAMAQQQNYYSQQQPYTQQYAPQRSYAPSPQQPYAQPYAQPQPEQQQPPQTYPQPQVGFSTWLSGFEQEAIARGIRPQTVYQALTNVYPDEGILEKDHTQPEHTVTAVDYWKRVVNERRISRGREFMRANHEILSRIADTYGVQPRYIVALLGVESDYGELQGSTSIVSALATLAYDGRRADFFKEELINALRILDQRHISPQDMVGSWAGAMGYCQFMPSSFLKYGQDFDADGRIDIWNSIPDAAASAANYLRESGWKTGESWGRAVRLKREIPEDMTGTKVSRTMSEWKRLGVVAKSGRALPGGSMTASLVIPDGGDGAAFLVYNNFNVIMRWNRSTYFATSVGMIADALGGER